MLTVKFSKQFKVKMPTFLKVKTRMQLLLMYLLLTVSINMINCDINTIHDSDSDYQGRWKEELLENNLESVYDVFAEKNLFQTEFLLYLNDEGFTAISDELCLELNEMDIYKLSTIAWKIHYQQNLIDDVSVHRPNDDNLNGDKSDQERRKEGNGISI